MDEDKSPLAHLRSKIFPISLLISYSPPVRVALSQNLTRSPAAAEPWICRPPTPLRPVPTLSAFLAVLPAALLSPRLATSLLPAQPWPALTISMKAVFSPILPKLSQARWFSDHQIGKECRSRWS